MTGEPKRLVRVIPTPNEQVNTAMVSAADRGFTLGDAIFETLRIYNGKPFRLQQHLSRMRASAAFMGLTVPAEIDAEIDSVVAEAAAIDVLDARLRITLSRGEVAAPGIAPPGLTDARPTLVLAMDPIGRAGRISKDGIAAVLAQSRRNERGATAGHKTVGFADAIVEMRRAQALGAEDCVFLDTQGHVAELSASHVFLYDGEVLLTPPLSCGVLPGITRAVVIELAARRGVAVEERAVEASELFLSREVFLTSSIREVVPLASVDGRKLRRSDAGDFTRAIGESYRQLVLAECS